MSRRFCLAALTVWALTAATVWAEPPLKALIVDGQNNHNWRETTPILQSQLEETGLFAVDVATSPPRGEDMSGFQPDFAAYDVVVLNYTDIGGGDRWPEPTERALEAYVAGGGGLVSYHAAASAFPDWEEYNTMIGLGGWGGRTQRHGPYVYWEDGRIVHDDSPGPTGTHGPQHAFPIVVRRGDHPITRGLPERFMHRADELFAHFRGRAKNMTVLATAYSAPEQRGSGRHEPMLLTVEYGEGRVFTTMLGHGVPQLASPAFQVTFQRGTEWAATGKVTQPVPDDLPVAED